MSNVWYMVCNVYAGRAVSEVLLNNMCECLNRWLVDGRDKPIITALEYCREYLMKRIVTVRKVIAGCNGPLTPTATKLFEAIKTDASRYTVTWGGSQRYQVNGPHNDQCVVDIGQRSCVCRRWEITGMPCKHAVAVIWNMGVNGLDVGMPETWVHRVYWLDTWMKTYSFTISPVNGRSHWPKSNRPITLLPPFYHTPAGRPKKNRRKTADERSSMNQGGKLSRQHKTVNCGNCGHFGHNRKKCTNTGVGIKRRIHNASNSGSKRKRTSGEASGSNEAAVG